VFDLAAVDIFRPGDVVCSFRKDDNETVKKFAEVMQQQGMEIWAYSDRGEYYQYLFVPDAEARRAVALASDQNSLAGIIPPPAQIGDAIIEHTAYNLEGWPSDKGIAHLAS